VPRASSRLVTFTDAIRSTSMTAPRTASSTGLTPRVISACSELTINPNLRDAQCALGNSDTGASAMVFSSRLA